MGESPILRKIVFFDYWTNGIRHFLPVYERLQRQGVESSMLHIGAWRDPSVANEETLHGIRCRDLRFYGNDLRRALIAEAPDVVLMLNTSYTTDRMLNRTCRSLGIRTAYMMHGIRATGENVRINARMMNQHWDPRKRLTKVWKYAQISLRYLREIARDQPLDLLLPWTYAHFVQLALWPGDSFVRPWRHKDIYADAALVFANAYRSLMIEALGYPAPRVLVTGNPELDPAAALKHDPAAASAARNLLAELGVPQEKPAAVYMEDAFVEQGIWQPEERLAELEQVAWAVNAAGYHLVIKLHPAANEPALQAHFGGRPGITVVKRADIHLLTLGSAVVIGHISSVLMSALVLDKPILVPGWDVRVSEFDYYVGKGAAIPARSPGMLQALLEKADYSAYFADRRRNDFIEEHITFTDGSSWDRVVGCLLALGGEGLEVPDAGRAR